jgi:hypothetical protein
VRGRLVASVVLALALSAAVALTTKPAGAAPERRMLRLEVNRAELRLGPSEPVTHASYPYAPWLVRARINPATGVIRAPADHVRLGWWGAVGDPATLLTTTVLGPLSGKFHKSSGRLDMTVPVGQVFGGYCDFGGCAPSCEFKGRWHLSTENAFAGMHGARFRDGPKGAGAVVAAWNDLPSRSEGDAGYCDSIRGSFGGPGAVRFAKHVNFDLLVRPEERTVEHGEWTSFTTVVKNASPETFADVRVCAGGKTGIRLEARPPQASGPQQCGPTRELPAGEKIKTAFFAKAWDAKPGSYRLRFITNSPYEGVVRVARLNVTGN